MLIIIPSHPFGAGINRLQQEVGDKSVLLVFYQFQHPWHDNIHVGMDNPVAQANNRIPGSQVTGFHDAEFCQSEKTIIG